MSERVLCVDDESRVLDGLELHLGMDYALYTAISGEEGLEKLQDEGPFDVVISDMRMPGMDGAAFLSAVRQAAPDTARILLTGHADTEAALRAVNEGGIFRFHTKPCHPDLLKRSIAEAVEIRRLRQAEQELLERTLRGSVEVLAEVLDVAVPTAFQRAQYTRTLVQRLAPGLDVPVTRLWQLEVAALLTGLGCIAVPSEVLARDAAGETLSVAEQAMLAEVPKVGSRLLQMVPRLEQAAELLRRAGPRGALRRCEAGGADLEAHVLQVALWAADASHRGMRWDRVKRRVERDVGRRVAHLLGSKPHVDADVIRALHARELKAGMQLCDDVRIRSTGCVVVGAGTTLTHALALRLQAFANNVGLVEPIQVRCIE
ncbi:MAG: response regulator [Polyangiales bacterium]